MSAQHTPGPWAYRTVHHAYEIRQDDTRGEFIASVVSRRGLEELPNARLIAAAPELLAALEEVLASHDAYPERHGRTSPYDYEWVVSARAAIAKAKGGE